MTGVLALFAGLLTLVGRRAAEDRRTRPMAFTFTRLLLAAACLAATDAWGKLQASARLRDLAMGSVVDPLLTANARRWSSGADVRPVSHHHRLRARRGKSGPRRATRPAALAATREARASGDVSYNPPMEDAALFVMQDRRTDALEALEAGVRAGWRDVLLRRDPLLAPLRGDPRFAAIVQQVEREVAAMRARADFSNLDDWAGRPVRGR